MDTAPQDSDTEHRVTTGLQRLRFCPHPPRCPSSQQSVLAATDEHRPDLLAHGQHGRDLVVAQDDDQRVLAALAPEVRAVPRRGALVPEVLASL